MTDKQQPHAAVPAEGWGKAYVPGPMHPSNQSPVPFNPQNIARHGDRWIFDGIDVTDLPVWWTCQVNPKHTYATSLRVRGSAHDPGCPECHVEAAEQTTSNPEQG